MTKNCNEFYQHHSVQNMQVKVTQVTENVPISSKIYSSNIIFKLCWLVTISLSLSGFIFYSYQAYKKWNIHPDISTRVKQISSSKIPLPAITICQHTFPNEIQMQITPLEYLNLVQQGKIVANLTVEEQNYMAVVMQVI